MAVTGKKLLKIAGISKFTFTSHAAQRILWETGVRLTYFAALRLFSQARQVTYEQLYLMGYRPNYRGRLANGVPSLYFRFVLEGRELIAVLTEDREQRGLVWVTTYAPTRQSEQLRVFRFDELPTMA